MSRERCGPRAVRDRSRQQSGRLSSGPAAWRRIEHGGNPSAAVAPDAPRLQEVARTLVWSIWRCRHQREAALPLATPTAPTAGIVTVLGHDESAVAQQADQGQDGETEQRDGADDHQKQSGGAADADDQTFVRPRIVAVGVDVYMHV